MASPVTVIVLTWNGLSYTKQCLTTLRANTDFQDYRLIVADNGSTDGTLDFLKSQPNLTLIENAHNLGFARANNDAIAQSDPETDVILLNNDCEVHQADWITALQNTAYSSPEIGIVGCRLRRPDGTLQHAGAYMPVDTFWGQQYGSLEDDINQYNDDREVESVVFACVYLKRELINAIGLLDTDYFSYFEDTDYCLRAQNRNYRVMCAGSVTLVHHENVSTRINRVEHGKLFRAAQAVFRAKWEKILLKERYTRQISWHSLLNFETGYAISSRELVSALDRKRVRVTYKYVYGPGRPFPVHEPEQSDTYLTNVIRSRNMTGGGIQVVYAQGDVFNLNSGDYKIGFTMLETDRIPKEWVRQANLMDEVWVPSTFNQRTFVDSGVLRPIHVVPLGVNQDYFNPRISAYALNGVFTFLSVFEWGERKNPELLLRAFADEFEESEPVILICKVLNNDPGVDVGEEVRRLGLRVGGGRIHLSLNQVVQPHQMGCLYRSADCFVLPTRGEGWGGPIIEAMACGLPVIATNWSAHCDFMNERNAYPLPIDGLISAQAKCPYYTGFRWADPSYSELRRLMRHVFENPGEARAKGNIASEDVRSNWNWDRASQVIVDHVDRIASDHAGKQLARPRSSKLFGNLLRRG